MDFIHKWNLIQGSSNALVNEAGDIIILHRGNNKNKNTENSWIRPEYFDENKVEWLIKIFYNINSSGNIQAEIKYL